MQLFERLELRFVGLERFGVALQCVQRFTDAVPALGERIEVRGLLRAVARLLEEDQCSFVALRVPQLEPALEALTREAIVAALEKVKGSISAAARELGVPRTTLYRNMDMFQIEPDAFRKDA